MKPLLSLVFIACILTTIAGAVELGCEFIPPEHWAYAALERFEASGFCALPSEKPFTRRQIIALIGDIEINLEGESVLLSRRDEYNLERLREEFSYPVSRSHPPSRYDAPLLYVEDEPLHLEFDLDLAFAPERKIFGRKTEYFLIAHPGGNLHLSDYLTYGFRYRLVFGPERGDRARNEKPSVREKSFKGLTSLFERSYLQFHTRRITLFWGREYVDWGPSNWGNLILSENAGSLDQFGLRISMRSFRFSLLHSPMSLERRRHLATHRLEVNWRKFVFGISESVIYARRGFDPVYAFPLSSFYANQFNERGDDNVLWSLDIKGHISDFMLMYGSLLIDDFQFERDGEAPDKLGFDIGWRLALMQPLPVTVRARYRYIDIHTYTHRDSMKAYVGGDGLLTSGDSILGGVGGPDSDEWRLELIFFPRRNLPATLGFFGVRRGEGNDFRQFKAGDDPYPPFPSGVVERTEGIELTCSLEIDGGSMLAFSWLWERIKNQGHIQGNSTDSTAFRLAIVWDL